MLRSTLCLALALSAMPAIATAALPVGAKAPDFATQVSLAGKPMPFSLKSALKKGPVVLYFYPAAFTKGCTIEAHDFAEATDDFKKLGATVIGMSADGIDKLNQFSVSECRNKFAVGSATPATISAYNVTLPKNPAMSDRTSAMDPAGHVTGTMGAVKAWAAQRKRG
jgi:peroxiredoxin Q/BCP